jgi:hypothetical protein
MTARMRRHCVGYFQAQRLSFLTSTDGASQASLVHERGINGWRTYYMREQTKARQLPLCPGSGSQRTVKRPALGVGSDVLDHFASTPLEEIGLAVG